MRAGWGWPRNRRPAFPRQGIESETATLMFGASPGRIAGPASQTSEPLGLPSERQSRPRSEGAYWGWPRWPRAKQRERVLTPRAGSAPVGLAVCPGCGSILAGRGVVFPKKLERRLSCTLLAFGAPGHEDRWYVLAYLPPLTAHAAWYSVRMWIEYGFEQFKSAG